MTASLFGSSLLLAAFAALPQTSSPQELAGPPVVRDGPEVPLGYPVEGEFRDMGEPRFEPAGQLGRELPRPAGGALGEGDDPLFLGFVGGLHRPPVGERVEPVLSRELREPAADERPRQERYAYVMLAERATDEVRARIEATGARVLGMRPHQSYAVALTAEAADRLPFVEGVQWVGYPPHGLKLDPRAAFHLAGLAPNERVSFIVSLFECDLGAQSRSETAAETEVRGPGSSWRAERTGERWASEGWQHRALETLGAEVAEYLPSIHAFRVRMDFDQTLLALTRDFVAFVELEEDAFAMHDDSQPMIGTDYTRSTYSGAFSGEAIAGQIDSGIDIAHTGLDHAWYLGWTLTGNSSWNDNCPHGSHVAGSTLARPLAALAEHRGAAPSLGFHLSRAFRNVKFMEPNPNPDGNACIGTGSSLESRFSFMRDPWTDGQVIAPRPHVVNNSWGTGSTNGGWNGTNANSRAVDAEVWNNNQAYVFAAGNFGPGVSTLSQEASAKNALAVGNVAPHAFAGNGPGTIWGGSSRGPTGDGRWKPNVVAPGRNVVSVTAGSGNDYNPGTGTSMAAPHVTGVVAQMVDRHAFLRYRPERIASLLMATASTRGGATLVAPGTWHHNTYGAGRVDALRAVGADNQHSSLNWGFTLGAAQNALEDFEVGANVRRLVVVMHYIEPAAAPGASQALVNDFDLVVDRAPFAAGITQGLFTAHQSSVDNTEIFTIDNPVAGAWRWKVHPVNASSSVRMSVTVHRVHGNPLPNPTLALQADKLYVKPNNDVQIVATVTNPSHVASAVYLTSASAGSTLVSSTMALKDGPVANLANNPSNSQGRNATLGNILHGTSRAVTWRARWVTEGIKTWSVSGTSDNGMNRNASVQVIVDGTPPGMANISSTSHQPGVWSAQPVIDLTWTTASDNLSGTAGYSSTVSFAPSMPPQIQNLGAVNQFSTGALGSSVNGYHFNLRAVDNAGNWALLSSSAGPYLIDTVPPVLQNVWFSNEVAPMTQTPTPQLLVSTQAFDQHSGVHEMRLKNEGGVWSPWMPYQVNKSWDLFAHGANVSYGTRRVEVQVRDQALHTAWGSANIYLYKPYWLFGAPGSGSLGAPIIDLEGAPGPGQLVTFHVANTQAPWRRLVLGAPGALWNGLPLPLDLGLIGSPGNWLHVAPQITLYEGPASQVNLPIPADGNLIGATLHAQWLLFGDPSGKPIVTTRGLGFELAGF